MFRQIVKNKAAKTKNFNILNGGFELINNFLRQENQRFSNKKYSSFQDKELTKLLTVTREKTLKYRLMLDNKNQFNIILDIISRFLDERIENIGQKITTKNNEVSIKCYGNELKIWLDRAEIKLFNQEAQIIHAPEHFTKISKYIQKISKNNLI